jgi:hypothetical protein
MSAREKHRLKFLHIPFANKGIDVINISNILNRKEVVKEIPPYFKNQSVPIVSVLKRRVGAVISQRVLKVLFYVNILQCFFVVENFTANAVSVAIGDNGNRLIFVGILDLTKEA